MLFWEFRLMPEMIILSTVKWNSESRCFPLISNGSLVPFVTIVYKPISNFTLIFFTKNDDKIMFL